MDKIETEKQELADKPEIDGVVIRRTVDNARDYLRRWGVSAQNTTVILGQFFLWLKLSSEKVLPSEFSLLPDHELWTEARFQAAANYLQCQNDLWSVAFRDISYNFNSQRGPALTNELTQHVNSIFSKGLVDWEVVGDAILSEDLPSSGRVTLPTEVVALCAKLAKITPTDQVYCAFEGSLKFALLAARISQRTCFEVGNKDSLNACLIGLSDNKIEATFSDPIQNPTYVENGMLRKFDVAFANGPFNAKRYITGPDEFGRFGKTSNSEVMEIGHLVAQTGRLAIGVVQNGFLFRTSQSERELKEDVIRKGWLSAVIALPAGLLSSVSLPINLLIFDKEQTSKSVLFVDASTDRFFETRKDKRSSRNRLICTDEIASLYASRQEGKRSKIVSKEDCEKNDYDLSPSRYVLSSEQEQSEQFLSTQETLPLSEVAEIIRGQAVKVGTERLQHWLLEVGGSDIGQDGLVRSPGKEVFVDDKDISKVTRDLGLRPGDIVMAVKGIVGRVGLVQPLPERPDGGLVPIFDRETSTEADPQVVRDSDVVQCHLPTNYIVGQSYVIIRPLPYLKSKGGEVPRKGLNSSALLMYLRSDVVQTWIKSKMSGSTVPMLQKQYIQGLPVVIPSPEEEEKLVERHNTVVRLFEEMSDIESQILDILTSPVFDR